MQGMSKAGGRPHLKSALKPDAQQSARPVSGKGKIPSRPVSLHLQIFYLQVSNRRVNRCHWHHLSFGMRVRCGRKHADDDPEDLYMRSMLVCRLRGSVLPVLKCVGRKNDHTRCRYRQGSACRSPNMIIALCGLLILFDGYDLIVYGAVAPSLLREASWALTPGNGRQ